MLAFSECEFSFAHNFIGVRCVVHRLNDLFSELESLNEEFSSYKRATQRDVLKMKKKIESIDEQLDEINKKIEEK